VVRVSWAVAFGLASVALVVSVGGLCLAIPALADPWFRWAAPAALVAFGGVVYVVSWRLCLRRWSAYRLLTTLDHEVTHALVGTLSGGGVQTLTATAQGQGTVTLARPNPFVAIAPYVMSIPLAVGLALASALPGVSPSARAALLGTLLAYHLVRVATSFRLDQPDLRHTTIPLGLVWILGANLLLSSLTIAVAADSLRGGVDLLAGIVRHLGVPAILMGGTDP